MVSQRSYLSIGDVLSLLREEFPDVTISKIRFLESQGLVDPERSPSGYRKFYDQDVARLRWVLRQQRDQFLPLRVIRDRLAAAGNGVPPDDEWTEVDLVADEEPAQAAPAPAPAAAASTSPSASPRAKAPSAAAPEPEAEAPAPGRAAPGADEPPAHRAEDDKPAEPAARPARGTRPGATEGADGVLSAAVSGVSLTLAELCAASGLSGQVIGSLESLGLIAPLAVAGGAFYDEEALTVAKLAAEFARFGIEPRHLKLYRNAADREVGLVEQVVTPLLRQRNPEARQRAVDASADLARLGQSLRAALVRTALRRQLGT